MRRTLLYFFGGTLKGLYLEWIETGENRKINYWRDAYLFSIII